MSNAIPTFKKKEQNKKQQQHDKGKVKGDSRLVPNVPKTPYSGKPITKKNARSNHVNEEPIGSRINILKITVPAIFMAVVAMVVVLGER